MYVICVHACIIYYPRCISPGPTRMSEQKDGKSPSNKQTFVSIRHVSVVVAGSEGGVVVIVVVCFRGYLRI